MADNSMSASESEPNPATPPKVVTGTALTPANAWVLQAPEKESGWKDYSDAASATGTLLWPLLIAAIVLTFRHSLRSMMNGLAKRVGDLDTSLKLGPVELTRRVHVLESKVASQMESEQADRGVLALSIQHLEDRPKEQIDVMERLRQLAREYKSVNISDWLERLRRKDEITAHMASLVISQKLPRDVLANDPDEAVRMAAIAAIHTDPQRGDDERLALAAHGLTLKHVKYRVMMAAARLATANLLAPRRVPEFLHLAETFRADADAPLLARIDGTVTILKWMMAPAGVP
jgi:hypothetical protein